jgi:hypothetical protein
MGRRLGVVWPARFDFIHCQNVIAGERIFGPEMSDLALWSDGSVEEEPLMVVRGIFKVLSISNLNPHASIFHDRRYLTIWTRLRTNVQII